MATSFFTASSPYALTVGCIPARWKYDDPEQALLAPSGSDDPTLRLYLADPTHPMWRESPYQLPCALIMLVDVQTVGVEICVHANEPAMPRSGSWDEIEQGGAEFGTTPRYLRTTVPSSDLAEQIPAGVIDSIAFGWNMIRVHSRNRYAFSTETEIAIDIWPIDGPAGREVLHRQPQQPPQTTSLHADDAALTLPSTEASLLVRTDFASDGTWSELVAEVRRPVEEIPGAQFAADVETISDTRYNGVTTQDLMDAANRSPIPPRYLFIADTRALADPERLILALDLDEQPGRELRVPPAMMWSIENNLSLGNMDFGDFVAASDGGVFRGF